MYSVGMSKVVILVGVRGLVQRDLSGMSPQVRLLGHVYSDIPDKYLSALD